MSFWEGLSHFISSLATLMPEIQTFNYVNSGLKSTFSVIFLEWMSTEGLLLRRDEFLMDTTFRQQTKRIYNVDRWPMLKDCTHLRV